MSETDEGIDPRRARLKELLAPIRRAEDRDRPAVAELLCRRLLEEFPSHAGTWAALANAQMNLARYGEAEASLHRALEHVPHDLAHIVHSKRGHLELLRGNRDLAMEHYGRAHELAPERAGPLIYLGSAQREAGDLASSEETFRRATLAPEGAIDEAHMNLARVLVSLKRHSEARESLGRALELDPHDASALALLDELDELESLARPPGDRFGQGPS